MYSANPSLGDATAPAVPQSPAPHGDATATAAPQSPTSPIAHASLNLSLHSTALFSHGGFQLPIGTLGTLTPFTGSDPVDRWLLTFDLFLSNNAHVFDGNEALKLKVLRSAMSGGAAQFLQDLIQQKDNRLDGYDELRTLLVQRFTDPRTEARKMRTLEQRKWQDSESLRNYADDIERLCREAIGPCKESVRIFHFCNGLPKQMSEFIQLAEPSTLTQAVKRAQAHESVYPRAPAPPEAPKQTKVVAPVSLEHSTPPHWAERMVESLETISSTCQRLDSRLNMVERSMVTAPAAKKARIERSDRFCDYCRIPGHTITECRNRINKAMTKLLEERPSLLEEPSPKAAGRKSPTQPK